MLRQPDDGYTFHRLSLFHAIAARLFLCFAILAIALPCRPPSLLPSCDPRAHSPPSLPLTAIPLPLPFLSSNPCPLPHLSPNQVEYANKAVEAAGVAVGLRCNDGIILGVERLLHSKLLVKGANRRIQSVDEHIGMATAGLLADGKHLGSRARDEAANFRETYNAPVTVQVGRHEP